MKTDVNLPSKSNKQKEFLVDILSANDKKKQDPNQDPEPYVNGTDPRIRIRTKM
jgi:hypothetical protein